jgi:hypothetical protein
MGASTSTPSQIWMTTAGDFVGLTGSGPYYGRDVVTDETTPNPIYVFETVDAYTDEIIGTIELG